MDDLKLLQRNGLIELRCIEPGEFGVCRTPEQIGKPLWRLCHDAVSHTGSCPNSDRNADHVDMNAETYNDSVCCSAR